MAEISSGVCVASPEIAQGQRIQLATGTDLEAGVGCTYKLLKFIPVLDLDDRLSLTADDLERPANDRIYEDTSRGIRDLIPRNHTPIESGELTSA